MESSSACWKGISTSCSPDSAMLWGTAIQDTLGAVVCSGSRLANVQTAVPPGTPTHTWAWSTYLEPQPVKSARLPSRPMAAACILIGKLLKRQHEPSIDFMTSDKKRTMVHEWDSRLVDTGKRGMPLGFTLPNQLGYDIRTWSAVPTKDFEGRAEYDMFNVEKVLSIYIKTLLRSANESKSLVCWVIWKHIVSAR